MGFASISLFSLPTVFFSAHHDNATPSCPSHLLSCISVTLLFCQNQQIYLQFCWISYCLASNRFLHQEACFCIQCKPLELELLHMMKLSWQRSCLRTQWNVIFFFFCTVRQQKLFICGFYWICIYPNTVHLFHLKHLKGPPCYSAIQQNAHYVFATMWEALWEVCSKAAWCNLDKCGRNEDQIEIVVAGKVGRSHRKSLTALSVCINWPTEGFLFVRHERNLSCCSWQYCCLSLLSPLLSTIFSVIIQEEMCWLHRKTPLSPLLAWDNPVGSPSQSNNWITRIFWVVKTWV